jgi:PAS domain S-box-containing protein
MANKLKVQTKLLLPLFILILMVLLLSTSLISHQYTKGSSLQELEKGIQLATKISRLVHATQKERGMSSGFLASKGHNFTHELLIQRTITDKKVKELYTYLVVINDKNIIHALKESLLKVNHLKIFRKKIDNLEVTVQDSIKFYSKMNDDLLNVIVEISKISKLPIITQNIIAYSNFLYAKENIGIERAIGTAILSQKSYNQSLSVSFINIIAIEKLYTKTFLQYASNGAKTFYNTIDKGKSITEVKKIQNIILYKDFHNGYNINAEYWFKQITNKINKLQEIDSYLEVEIVKNIQNELTSTYELFGGFAFLNLLSILIFLSVLILIIRLIKNEKRLKSIVDKYIISSTTDLKGKITDVSEAFCDISGFTREEIIGKNHNVIRHPDMPKSAFKDLWKTIQQGKPWRGEVKNLKKDGGYYWVYANIEPLLNKHGVIEGYVAIRLDITDSVHLEEELVRSKEKDKTLLHQSKLAQMGEMISMIAHQWRQPLTAISSTSSDMFMKILLDNYNKDYFSKKLEKIDDLSQHLSQTIDDFRNFYKEDKEKEKVLYSDIVKGAISIVSSSLEYKNIDLISDFKCQKYIYILKNELRQVILNLIKNAEDILIEKEIEKPFIKVKTYDDSLYSYLEVSDNGGGIPEDIINDIFDPYFSTKTQKDGTGLGLYMSKMIVEEHCNGSLTISNGIDGAIFLIQIPLYKENLDV